MPFLIPIAAGAAIGAGTGLAFGVGTLAAGTLAAGLAGAGIGALGASLSVPSALPPKPKAPLLATTILSRPAA
jgi:hypothetical protein